MYMHYYRTKCTVTTGPCVYVRVITKPYVHMHVLLTGHVITGLYMHVTMESYVHVHIGC